MRAFYFGPSSASLGSVFCRVARNIDRSTHAELPLQVIEYKRKYSD